MFATLSTMIESSVMSPAGTYAYVPSPPIVTLTLMFIRCPSHSQGMSLWVTYKSAMKVHHDICVKATIEICSATIEK